MKDAIHTPSPNWNERPGGTCIDTVVIHYTGMQSGEAALRRLCDPKAEVSAHYLIEEDGRLFQLVDEEKRAWHAGVSSWRGQDNINHNSIGIELVNPGHEFGYRPFPEPQIERLISLLSHLKSCYNITVNGFVGHSDIAPGRKLDPGPLFPWKKLAENGFGLWPRCDGKNSSKVMMHGQENVPKSDYVIKLNKQLGIVGYHLGDIQSFNATHQSVVRAFQAHWRPETVSGLVDIGTAMVLEDIAGQIRQ